MRRPRGAGTIHYRGAESTPRMKTGWVARIRLGDGRRQSIYGATYEDVANKLDEFSVRHGVPRPSQLIQESLVSREIGREMVKTKRLLAQLEMEAADPMRAAEYEKKRLRADLRDGLAALLGVSPAQATQIIQKFEHKSKAVA